MKVVLDTNVLVSALLIPGSVPGRILQRFRDGLFTLVISGKILEEYGEVLNRPRFGLVPEKIDILLKEIESRSLVVIPLKRHRAVPADPDDNEFVDVAVQGKADFIVTGDAHLLDLTSFRSVAIVSPTEFLEKQ